MADRGPKPKVGESETFQVTLPKDHYDYLEHLVRMSRFGTKVNDAAAFILTRELDRLLQDDYHKKSFP